MFRLIVVLCLLCIVIGCGGKQKATADTDVPVSVDSMPSLVSMPEPYYPEATKESGGKGEVIIRAFINTDGEVGATNVEKSSGYPELDAAAISAVCELTERSVAAGSQPMQFPDFTRGRWRTWPKLGIVTA